MDRKTKDVKRIHKLLYDKRIGIDEAIREFGERYKGEEFKDVMWHFSVLLRMHGFYNEAFVCVEKLIAITDNSEQLAQFYLNLGQLKESMSDFEAAILYYLHAQSLQPAEQDISYFIHNNLGFCFNLLERYEEAEGYCRAAITINDERHNAYKNLGIALQGKGQYVDAARNFIMATEIRPSDFRARALLKSLVEEHGELSDQLPDMQRLLAKRENLASSAGLDRETEFEYGAKMNKCHEFYILSINTIRADGEKEPPWEMSSLDTDTSGEIIDFLQKHNKDSDQFFYNVDAMYKQYGVWPWAIVLFDEEFRLAGHVASVRKDKKDILFSAYSIRTSNYSVAEMGVPSVSHLYVYRKGAIEEAAMKSELFKAAWKRLRDLPEHRHWICIADSPSEEWVKHTSQNDDELFMKIIG